MNNEPAYKLDEMPCGGTPIYDVSRGIGYFCDTCYAVIGSISQPRDCVELNGRANKEGPNVEVQPPAAFGGSAGTES